MSESGREPDDFLGDCRLVGLQFGAQLPDARGEALLHRDPALVGGCGDELDAIGHGRAVDIQVAAQVIAFARPHRVEIDERLRDDRTRALDEVALEAFVGIGLPLTNRQRLGQAQEIARRQRPGHQSACSSLIERGEQRLTECLVELDFHPRNLSKLQRQAQLDAPARDMAADERTNLSFDDRQQLRNPQSEVQMPMVQRSNRHRHRRALVLAGDGREPSH